MPALGRASYHAGFCGGAAGTRSVRCVASRAPASCSIAVPRASFRLCGCLPQFRAVTYMCVLRHLLGRRGTRRFT